ncbi:MAG: Rieske 2Fe-2S domain-containing protein [Bdellovibrionia bacterium]
MRSRADFLKDLKTKPFLGLRKVEFDRFSSVRTYADSDADSARQENQHEGEEAESQQEQSREILESEWVVIADSSEIQQVPVHIKKFNLNTVAWRTDQGEIVVFEDRCPHRKTPLSQGTIAYPLNSSVSCIRCRAHGLHFDQNGEWQSNSGVVKQNQTFRAQKYEVIEQENQLWIRKSDLKDWAE